MITTRAQVSVDPGRILNVFWVGRELATATIANARINVPYVLKIHECTAFAVHDYEVIGVHSHLGMKRVSDVDKCPSRQWHQCWLVIDDCATKARSLGIQSHEQPFEPSTYIQVKSNSSKERKIKIFRDENVE